MTVRHGGCEEELVTALHTCASRYPEQDLTGRPERTILVVVSVSLEALLPDW